MEVTGLQGDAVSENRSLAEILLLRGAVHGPSPLRNRSRPEDL